MKKLMIAAAIVCAAAFAQAATIQWGIEGVSDAPKAVEGVADGNYYVYAFLTDGAGLNTTATLDAVLAAYAAGEYPEEVVGGLSYAEVNWSTSAATINMAGLDVTGASSENPIVLQAMAVVFDSWNPDPTDDSAPVMSNYQVLTKSFEFLEDGTLSSTSTAANAWQSVPEPTTGLLMLIGMGALALRRRRA